MPGTTTINIQLGIKDVTSEGVLIGAQKAINLIAGDNIEIEALNNPGMERIDVTFNSTGGTPAKPIPTTTVSYTELPKLIATTMPADSNIAILIVELSGVTGTFESINIGIEGVQEDYFIIEDGSDGISATYSPSISTLTANKNLTVKAVGGSMTAGTIKIKAQTIN